MTLASGAAATQSADDPVKSATLLSGLHEAHARLLAAMEALDGVTRQPFADRARFTDARSELSSASHARRLLWKECFQYLRPIVDPGTAQRLESANREHFKLLGLAAAHVARWPADAVEREWHPYCKASRAYRSRLAAAIEVDKQLLYPLLQP